MISHADTVTAGRVQYRDGRRGWLSEIRKIGELLQVSGVHWNAEMGSITQMLTEKSAGTPPAILFDEIPGYPTGFARSTAISLPSNALR